jgi:hypothetical protein
MSERMEESVRGKIERGEEREAGEKRMRREERGERRERKKRRKIFYNINLEISMKGWEDFLGLPAKFDSYQNSLKPFFWCRP